MQNKQFIFLYPCEERVKGLNFRNQIPSQTSQQATNFSMKVHKFKIKYKNITNSMFCVK